MTKKEIIKLLAQAIGDGNIRVHFHHSSTIEDEVTGMVSYVFGVNGTYFRTGLYDSKERFFLKDRNEYLVSTDNINLVLWYVNQSDTEMLWSVSSPEFSIL
jgi:hypothetical protein